QTRFFRAQAVCAAGVLRGKRLLNFNYDRIRHVEILQDSAQTVRQLLFTEIGQVTFPAPARAVVVHVALFLDLRRDQAIVVRATQQAAGKRELVMAVFGPVVSGKDFLNALEDARIDKQRMRAFVRGVAPLAQPDVERILQQLVQVSLGIHPTRLLPNFLAQISDGQITVREQCKNALHGWRSLWVYLDAVLSLVVAV